MIPPRRCFLPIPVLLAICIAAFRTGAAAPDPLEAARAADAALRQAVNSGPASKAYAQAPGNLSPLVRARAAAMRALLRESPEDFIALSWREAERAALPPDLRGDVERRVSGEGEINVVVVCAGGPNSKGSRFEAFTRLAGEFYQIHGCDFTEAVPGRFEIRGVALGNDIVLTADPAPAARAMAAAPAAAADSWTKGTKKLLFIRVLFADSDEPAPDNATIEDSLAKTAAFLSANSSGQFELLTTLVPQPLRLPHPESHYEFNSISMREDALAAAGSAGFDPSDYDLDAVWSPYASADAGSATLGGRGIFLNSTTRWSVLAHELGHNLGLHHANYREGSSSVPIGSGRLTEYGDILDVMGASEYEGHFSVPAKAKILGWIPTADIHDGALPGLYRIFRNDDEAVTGPRGIRIPIEDGEDCWVGVERKLPASVAYIPDFERSVTVRVSRQNRTTEMIEIRAGIPGSVAASGLLPIGESLVDTERGFAIIPRAFGGAPPNEWVDVEIARFTGTGLQEPRLIWMAPVNGFIPSRTDISFRVSAADPNGDPLATTLTFSDGQTFTGTEAVRRFPGPMKIGVTARTTDGSHTVEISKEFTVEELILKPIALRRNAREEGVRQPVLWENGRFVVPGPASALVSQDGITWHEAAYPEGTTLSATHSGYGGGQFRVFGPGGGCRERRRRALVVGRI